MTKKNYQEYIRLLWKKKSKSGQIASETESSGSGEFPSVLNPFMQVVDEVVSYDSIKYTATSASYYSSGEATAGNDFIYTIKYKE